MTTQSRRKLRDQVQISKFLDEEELSDRNLDDSFEDANYSPPKKVSSPPFVSIPIDCAFKI